MAVEKTKKRSWAGVGFGGIFLGVGLLLLVLAYFFGDTTARNQSTGNSEEIGPVLCIVGGVFSALGAGIITLIIKFGSSADKQAAHGFPPVTGPRPSGRREFCTNCGNELAASDKFCSGCGDEQLR